MTSRIASSVKNKQLVLHHWDAPSPIGVVQIVHGMREHMGRYSNFAEYLCQHGFSVCGHDQLGHGLTAEQDGSYGYFGAKDGARALVRDAGRVTMSIQRRYPGLPIFLFGHSMGSFVGRLYILQASDALSGFVCMGTSGLIPAAPYNRVFSEAMARLTGERRTSALLSRIIGMHTARGGPKGVDKFATSGRDEVTASPYSSDRHTRHRFTNRGVCDLFDLLLASNNDSWASSVDPELPVLLVSGGSDPVGNYGRDVVAIFEELKKAKVRDVKCRLYDGARHDLLNEFNREEIYYDLLCWMEDRL